MMRSIPPLSRRRQRGLTLVEIAIAVALGALMLIVVLEIMHVYQKNMKISLAAQKDDSRLNDVMGAAARYGYYCPSPKGVNKKIQDLANLGYLGTDPKTAPKLLAEFDNIDGKSVELTIQSDPTSATSSVKVTLTGNLLSTLSPDAVKYYQGVIHASKFKGSTFTITRNYGYSTYDTNDFGLGLNFRNYTDLTPSLGPNKC